MGGLYGDVSFQIQSQPWYTPDAPKIKKEEIMKTENKKVSGAKIVEDVKTSHEPTWIRKSWSNNHQKKVYCDNKKNGVFSGNMMSKRIKSEISQ